MEAQADLRWVVVAALIGFVLGVVAGGSIAHPSESAGSSTAAAHTSIAGAIDDDANAVVEVSETPTPQTRPTQTPPIAGTTGTVPSDGSDVKVLAARHLTIPVQGVSADKLVDSFQDARTGHEHEALDILAPRNTPVLAVEDGTIAKLFLSKAGGTTIYQFDPSGQYCYYYAHLERYADGLGEGNHVTRGQVIAYVGTSGNAPKNTPHLHFAIFRLTPEKHWWQGTAIDPYYVLR